MQRWRSSTKPGSSPGRTTRRERGAFPGGLSRPTWTSARTRSQADAWSRGSSPSGWRGSSLKDLPDAVVEEAGRAFVDFLGESLFVGAEKPWGRLDRRVLCRGRGRPARGHHHRVGQEDPRLPRGPGQRNDGPRLREYADFGVGPSRPYPFAVTARWRWPSPAPIGCGPRSGHRDRLRGHRAGDPGHPEVPLSLLRSVGLRHLRRRAGSARLLGLSPQHTNYALGLAAAFAGGTSRDTRRAPGSAP